MSSTDRFLPIILSIPHAGFGIPEEVKDRLRIHETDLYNEADLWADQHFDFSARDLIDLPGYAGPALASVSMPIARGLIDVNRFAHDLVNPDGPVKARTSYGRPIYTEPLDEACVQTLMQRYYTPFQTTLTEAVQAQTGQARLFLDCHNMAQHGPTSYRDPGAARPLITLANMGDSEGEPREPGAKVSFEPTLFRKSAAIAAQLFADLQLLQPQGPVQTVILNWPFGGGPILRNHVAGLYSLPGTTPIPGIMVEVNRGLFVGDQSADTPIAPPNQDRIAEVRRRLYAWAQATVSLLD